MTSVLKLLLLDRDGVLNAKPLNNDYVLSEESLEINYQACTIIQNILFKIPVAVITNQQCVGKGLISMESLSRIHNRLNSHINANQIFKLKFFVCTHLESQKCLCRKPRPGLILDALKFYGSNPHETIFIGDQISDEQAAIAAGVEFKFTHSFEQTIDLLNQVSSSLHDI